MGLISLLKKKYKTLLFTTPSHDKRFTIVSKFRQWYKYDISEVDTLEPEKELEKAEKKAAKIYGTKYTKFLTNGSTSGVIAAVLSCAKNKKILIWENAHRCHKNAAELARCETILYKLPTDSETGLYKAITPLMVEQLIDTHNADAIVITSPTYEGYAADVVKISKICKKKQVKLIVDEAHGALYPFSDELPISAVKYADYTIQSLHKTAGGLNPTALLHSNDINPEESLKKINTTSPSYPMLATIEANINYLNSTKGRKSLDNLIKNIKKMKSNITNYDFLGDDETKILIKQQNKTGQEVSEYFYNKFNIEDEISGEKTVMFLTGIGTSLNKLKKLEKALKS